MSKRRNYIPLNPAKYNGSYPIVLKSSWEEEFARVYCDMNPSCLEWAYEPWKIPYRNPLTGKQTIYIPDFLMCFQGNDGTIKTALVEIKPLHEAVMENARNLDDAQENIRNLAKWEAAIAWCARRNGVEFAVLTEVELFGAQPKKVSKPKAKKISAPPKRRVKKS